MPRRGAGREPTRAEKVEAIVQEKSESPQLEIRSHDEMQYLGELQRHTQLDRRDGPVASLETTVGTNPGKLEGSWT